MFLTEGLGVDSNLRDGRVPPGCGEGAWSWQPWPRHTSGRANPWNSAPPVSLGIVCFWINPTQSDLDESALEDVDRKVFARIFWEDRAFLSSTLLQK